MPRKKVIIKKKKTVAPAKKKAAAKKKPAVALQPRKSKAQQKKDEAREVRARAHLAKLIKQKQDEEWLWLMQQQEQQQPVVFPNVPTQIPAQNYVRPPASPIVFPNVPTHIPARNLTVADVERIFAKRAAPVKKAVTFGPAQWAGPAYPSYPIRSDKYPRPIAQGRSKGTRKKLTEEQVQSRIEREPQPAIRRSMRHVQNVFYAPEAPLPRPVSSPPPRSGLPPRPSSLRSYTKNLVLAKSPPVRSSLPTISSAYRSSHWSKKHPLPPLPIVELARPTFAKKLPAVAAPTRPSSVRSLASPLVLAKAAPRVLPSSEADIKPRPKKPSKEMYISHRFGKPQRAGLKYLAPMKFDYTSPAFKAATTSAAAAHPFAQVLSGAPVARTDPLLVRMPHNLPAPPPPPLPKGPIQVSSRYRSTHWAGGVGPGGHLLPMPPIPEFPRPEGLPDPNVAANPYALNLGPPLGPNPVPVFGAVSRAFLNQKLE